MKISKDTILTVALLAAILIGCCVAMVAFAAMVYAVSQMFAPWVGTAFTVACLALVALVCLIVELTKQ